MRTDMSGVVRRVPGGRPAGDAGSWRAPRGTDEQGAVATEFVLLTSLIAAVTVGLAAVTGAWVDQPLKALVSALGGLTGVN